MDFDMRMSFPASAADWGFGWIGSFPKPLRKHTCPQGQPIVGPKLTDYS